LLNALDQQGALNCIFWLCEVKGTFMQFLERGVGHLFMR